MQKGDQEQFFKNRPKSSPRLNGPKAHWRKWHYPLSSTHLKCKDWRTFWFKQRLQTFPNNQVKGIFEKSFKTRIFWKKGTGGPMKIFQKSSKKRPRLKGPKAHLRKWHYPLISMHLKGKDWRRFWGKKAAPKVPEWPSYGSFGKVTQNPHFLKTCKEGTKENFSKNRPKRCPRWKALQGLWRKWHYALISMHLKCKDWKWFWRKKRLQTVPKSPGYGNFRKVIQNPHFL